MEEKIKEYLENMTENIDYNNIHWIGGRKRNGESYDAEDLCYDCCKKKVDNINKRLVEHSDYKAFIDGGWDARETDNNAICDSCGDYLTYSLISKDSELSHFNMYLEEKDILDEDICYQLLNLLECSDFNKDNEEEKKLLNKIRDLIFKQ